MIGWNFKYHRQANKCNSWHFIFRWLTLCFLRVCCLFSSLHSIILQKCVPRSRQPNAFPHRLPYLHFRPTFRAESINLSVSVYGSTGAMASSFRIHEDQENSALALRKENADVFSAATQRRALGDLSQFACNQTRSVKLVCSLGSFPLLHVVFR